MPFRNATRLNFRKEKTSEEVPRGGAPLLPSRPRAPVAPNGGTRSRYFQVGNKFNDIIELVCKYAVIRARAYAKCVCYRTKILITNYRNTFRHDEPLVHSDNNREPRS